MSIHPTLRSLLVIAAFSVMIYSMVDGIRYGSTTGVLLAAGSMMALYISIRLSRKLAKLNAEAEEEQ